MGEKPIKKPHLLSKDTEKGHEPYELSNANPQYPYESVPEQFRKFVSPEKWQQYSLAKQESIVCAYENPNAFYYRNRPPGDPRKLGKLTEEETEQVIQRVRYFRQLGIRDGYWGLFSVPIRGRLGYQCAQFYKALVKDGKISEPEIQSRVFRKSGDTSTPNGIDVLQREAFDFLEKCMKEASPTDNAFDGIPSAKKKPQQTTQSEQVSEEPSPKPKKAPSPVPPPPTPKLPDHKKIHFGHIPSEVITEFAKISYNRRIKGEQEKSSKNNYSSNDLSPSDFDDEEDNRCALLYAPDPVTHQFMQYPLFDPISRIVLDLTTWKMIVDGDLKSPYPYLEISSMNDLIPLNKKTYTQVKSLIRNIIM